MLCMCIHISRYVLKLCAPVVKSILNFVFFSLPFGGIGVCVKVEVLILGEVCSKTIRLLASERKMQHRIWPMMACDMPLLVLPR